MKENLTKENLTIDRIAQNTLPVIPIIAEEQKYYFNEPTNPAVKVMKDIINSGERDIVSLPNRRALISHKNMLQLKGKNDRKVMLYENNEDKLTVTISDINKLAGNNRTVNKMFTLLLSEIQRQAIDGKNLYKDYVTFSVSQIVGLGIYSNRSNAVKGLDTVLESLKAFSINGKYTIYDNKKKTNLEIEKSQQLFIGSTIVNKEEYAVSLNTNINWQIFGQYFTVYPYYYYKLSTNGVILLGNILDLARQRTKELTEKGYFKIKISTIRNILALPTEENLIKKNPKKYIKDPIFSAIDEILTAHERELKDNDLMIKLDVTKDTRLTEFLNGNLFIYLKGKLLQEFVDLQLRSEDQKKKAFKRKENFQKLIADKTADKIATAQAEAQLSPHPQA